MREHIDQTTSAAEKFHREFLCGHERATFIPFASWISDFRFSASRTSMAMPQRCATLRLGVSVVPAAGGNATMSELRQTSEADPGAAR
jgi:hypothetical protein